MAIARLTSPPNNRDASDLTDLMLSAGRPYCDWVGHDDSWRRFLRESIGAETAEHSYRWVAVSKTLNDQVDGVTVTVPAGEIEACRQRDSLAFILSTPPEMRGSLLRSLRAVEGALPPVPAGCAYLSKVAVRESSRGSGLGEQLLDFVMREANEQGQPIALHVASDNESARRIYMNAGFKALAMGAVVRGSRYMLLRGPT